MDGEHTAGTPGQSGSISMVSVYLSEICLSLLDRICTSKFRDIKLLSQLHCQGLVVSEGEAEVEGQEEGLTEELWIKYRCTILAQLY